MTREKEIRQASIEYTIKDIPMCVGGSAFSEVVDEVNRNHAFEEGAKWAGATMIEKACNWLKNIMYIQTDYEEDIDGVGCTFSFLTCDFDSVDEFIEYFKKAIEK